MNSIREEKVSKLIQQCLTLTHQAKLSREEIVTLLGQLLIRVGYSLYFQYENPAPKDKRPLKIEAKEAARLYESNPTTGTTLMQIGFDLQEKLLVRNERV